MYWCFFILMAELVNHAYWLRCFKYYAPNFVLKGEQANFFMWNFHSILLNHNKTSIYHFNLKKIQEVTLRRAFKNLWVLKELFEQHDDKITFTCHNEFLSLQDYQFYWRFSFTSLRSFSSNKWTFFSSNLSLIVFFLFSQEIDADKSVEALTEELLDSTLTVINEVKFAPLKTLWSWIISYKLKLKF